MFASLVPLQAGGTTTEQCDMALNFKKPPRKRRYLSYVLIVASIILFVLMFVAATR